MKFLAVEDIPETTDATIKEMRRLGHVVHEVRSVAEARQVLDDEAFDGVMLDQQIEGATEEEVIELARDIASGNFKANHALYFIWITAYFLKEQKEKMPGCIGSVSKADDATASVNDLFTRALDGYFDQEPPELVQDQVLMEVRLDAESRELGNTDVMKCNIPAWRPDEDFTMARSQLPEWIGLAVRIAPGRPIYVSVRANLNAEGPAELDLKAYRKVSESDTPESELWDD